MIFHAYLGFGLFFRLFIVLLLRINEETLVILKFPLLKYNFCCLYNISNIEAVLIGWFDCHILAKYVGSSRGLFSYENGHHTS